MELEAHEATIFERDEDERVVADARGSTVAFKGEFGDGIKLGEEGTKMNREMRDRAVFAVAGAERLENAI